MIHLFTSKQAKSWLALLSLLLLTALAGNAQAASTASFSASGAGLTNNLTLTVTVNIADADIDLTGNYYAGFCSGQVILATSLWLIQYFCSDSFGDNPPLC